ncbi:hypothetical protein HK101_010820 [Irineochytrium annulatum]|nr:hypothetical protein HK101_010820 [Irineochytrium annulatum]
MFVDQISVGIPILRLTGSKILFYCHFPDKLLTKRQSLLKRLYRIPFDLIEEVTTRMADDIVVNSNFTRSTFKKVFSLIPRLPNVLYPGINLGSYDEGVDETSEDVAFFQRGSKQIFLSINRFERKKNIPLALKSFAKLSKLLPSEFPGLQLVIAGGYDPRNQENLSHLSELKALAEELGLATGVLHSSHPPPDPGVNVLFLPSFTNAQRTYLLRKALLLLYTPSMEHFGIVPCEAMYSGLPVLAVNDGGPVESVKDGVTGWLREPDADKWADVLKTAVRGGKDGKAAMGAEGRKWEIAMDIRNFFAPANGRKPTPAAPVAKRSPPSEAAAGSGKKASSSAVARKRKVVEEDTEDDEAVEIKSSPAKPVKGIKSAYFDRSSNKKMKDEPVDEEDVTPSAKKAKAAESAGKKRGAGWKAKGAEVGTDNNDTTSDVEPEILQQIAELESSARKGKSSGSKAVMEDADDSGSNVEPEILAQIEEMERNSKPKKASAKAPPVRPPAKSPGRGKVRTEDDEATDVDEPPVLSSSKRKADDGGDAPAKKPRSSPARPAPAKKDTPPVKKEKEPPKTEEERAEARKANFAKIMAKKKAGGGGALNPGSKTIPQGEPNCLSGLTFVFTGEFEALSRDGAMDLVKRYGGRVTGAVSKKTDYIVVGVDPGESKTKKANDLGTKQLDEDALLALVAGSRGKPEPGSEKVSTSKGGKGKASLSKKAKTEEAPDAAEQSSFHSSISGGASGRLMGTDKENQALAGGDARGRKGGIASHREMWTTKYKPKTYDDVMGNKGNVQKIAAWLKAWDPNGEPPKSVPKESPGAARAILISGPPGIGKTTSAHLVAALEGFEAIEFNASDTRSKKSVNQVVREMTGSHTISEFYGEKTSKGKGKAPEGKKQILIMDEVDGMSSGDRGGIGELISIIKRTKVPIICICNDRQSQKLKSLVNSCYDMRFHKEGLTLKYSVIDNLIKATQGDIRQILNMLENYALDATVLDFDGSKTLSKSSEKNMATNMWDIAAKLLNRVSFREMTFNEKLELYFQDHSIIPLMIHENYMKMAPAMAADVEVNTEIGTMRLLSGAADACRDADVIDSMLRRFIFTTNNWGLMPLHGAMSTVLPAFFMHGQASGQVWGSNGGFGFPGWLGKNSTQQKTTRQLRELHAHMRLKISGDKGEIRRNYLPVLAPRLTLPMARKGNDGIDDVIELMDEYYIDREAWEALIEMGLGKNESKKLLMDIPAQVKSAFTRQYNKTSHPQPTMTAVTAAKVKAAKAAVPDLEDAVEVEEDVPEEEEAVDGEGAGEASVEADKMIKKKGGAGKKGDDAKARGAASKSGSSKGGSSKGRGGGAARGKGKKSK